MAKITSRSTNLRKTVTDKLTGKKVEFYFELQGTVTEKREQAKEIELFLLNAKNDIKKMSMRQLMIENEILTRSIDEKEGSRILNIQNYRNDRAKQNIDKIWSVYMSSKFSKVAEKTNEIRLSKLNKLIKFASENGITKTTHINSMFAQKFLDSLSLKNNATYNKYITDLRSIFNAIDKNNNPFANIDNKKESETATRKKDFTTQEMDAIQENCPAEFRQFFLVSRYTGMDIKDVVHLSTSNIVYHEGSKQHIIRDVRFKAEKANKVIMLPILEPIKFLIKESKEDEYFFPELQKKYGTGLRAGNNLVQKVNKIIKKAGVQGKTHKCYRHTFISNLRKLPHLTAQDISDSVGHVGVKITDRYGENKRIINIDGFLEIG